jgi:hypothetical protein
LKGDAFRVEQLAQTLVADVLYHLLLDQVLSELGQAPRREREVVVSRARERDPLDLGALGLGVLGRAPTAIAGIERVEAVSVEVADHVTHTVSAREGDPGDLGGVHALGGEQDHLRPAPGHDRARAAAHRSQQPVALLV